MAFDVYQTVTDKIVAALETAQKWQQPWTVAFGTDALARPVNAVSKRPYSGINIPLLWSARRSTPYWATYRQWQGIGAQVRRGEKASLIIFWKQIERTATDDENGEDGEDTRRRHLIARAYFVFNSEQVDGWHHAPQPSALSFNPIKAAEQFVASTGADIRFGGNRAFYTPAADFVQMPHRSQFVGTKTSTAAESYYAMLSHELVHWSGHPSRCARDLSGRFGSESYAMEELVAELGSAFLCADLGIAMEPRPDHAHYIADWLRVLNRDNRAVFTAASKAEQAVRFLMDHQWQPAAPLALAA